MINRASNRSPERAVSLLGRNLKAMSVSDTSLQRSLTGLELALTGHRRAVRRRLSVSDEELTVLLHLAHAGGAHQARLAELTGLSRSGSGALVQRLEQAGFIERRADAGDRRLRRVELTAAGAARLARARTGLDAAVARISDAPPASLTALERALDDLAATLESLPGERGAATTAYADALDPVWRRWS
jgi:MarR family transcriptional regulator for hemolysin